MVKNAAAGYAREPKEQEACGTPAQDGDETDGAWDSGRFHVGAEFSQGLIFGRLACLTRAQGFLQPEQPRGKVDGIATQLIVFITGLEGFLQACLDGFAEKSGGDLIVDGPADKQTGAPGFTQRIDQQAGI